MARALFVLLVAPVMALGASAQAQTGGIQVAPVMVAMSGERSIASVRLRNGRAAPVAFEVDVYDWRQDEGRDVLTPSRDLIVAPGVFEIAARGEQVVRLGVLRADADAERAFRIVLRELPGRRAAGGLGFTLELSLPVFVAPAGARGQLVTHTALRQGVPVLVLANTGRAHLQIAAVEDVAAGAMDTPRYLLAGTQVELALAPDARTIRVVAADLSGAPSEHVVHVGRQDFSARVR